MSIIITKKQVKKILEYLGDDGDDDTEIRIREGYNDHRRKSGVFVSFPKYDEDGEAFFEKN